MYKILIGIMFLLGLVFSFFYEDMGLSGNLRVFFLLGIFAIMVIALIKGK